MIWIKSVIDASTNGNIENAFAMVVPVTILKRTVRPAIKSPKIKLVLICWFNENVPARVCNAVNVVFGLFVTAGSGRIKFM